MDLRSRPRSPSLLLAAVLCLQAGFSSGGTVRLVPALRPLLAAPIVPTAAVTLPTLPLSAAAPAPPLPAIAVPPAPAAQAAVSRAPAPALAAAPSAAGSEGGRVFDGARPRAPRAAPVEGSWKDPRSQPGLPKGTAVNEKPFPPIRYARAAGKAFIRPISWNQVIQGLVGSCYLLSPLAALALVDPGFVRKMVRSTGRGRYAVTLFHKGKRAVTVGVDALLPKKRSGRLAFARGRQARELWPALVEKAYAKLLGSYAVLNQGGHPKKAFAALTGKPASNHYPTRRTLDSLWRLLVGSLEAGRPVVASTRAELKVHRFNSETASAGLIENHAYLVVKISERAGRRFVTLYTPLSRIDAGYPTGGPRLIVIPLETFKKHFFWVTVGSI